jgi:acetyl-CoA acyltransferase
MTQAVIVDAVRTPIGKVDGALALVHPADLLGHTVIALLNRAGVDPSKIDDHIAGCVSQVGEQSYNIARNAWLSGGLPETVPATTIDRQCGSSQQAVQFAAQAVMAGTNHLVVASGVESMSRVRLGTSMAGASPFPETMVSRYRDKLVPQGIAAELVASRWRISRDEQDDFGYRSHLLAGAATRAGHFKQEIEPMPVTDGDGSEILIDVDEGIRLDPDRERMRALPPAFQESRYEELFPGELVWSITAGNSSQISDGAAAVLVADEGTAAALGLGWRARIVSFAVAANDPVLMLTATIPATHKALASARLELSQIDVVEISEAFASPVLAWKRDMDVSDVWFDDRVNPNGGAIALGHPLGASGTRLLSSLVFELERRGGRYGLQVMCEGGGMANATIIERNEN